MPHVDQILGLAAAICIGGMALTLGAHYGTTWRVRRACLATMAILTGLVMVWCAVVLVAEYWIH